jgi:hypothetical protein
MGNTRKDFLLLFGVILVVSSLIMVESATAQSIPKPSVPQFSLKYFNQSIEVRILNQPFAPFTAKGHTMGLYYDIRWKEHSAVDWNYLYPHSFLFVASNSASGSVADSSITIVSYGLNANKGNDAQLNGDFVGKQLDFQIQASIGYYMLITRQVNENLHYPFDGEISGYSNTQTINIPQDSTNNSPSSTPIPSSSPNPTPTPTVPELPIWIIPLLLTIMLVSASLLVYHKKHKKGSVNNS